MTVENPLKAAACLACDDVTDGNPPNGGNGDIDAQKEADDERQAIMEYEREQEARLEGQA